MKAAWIRELGIGNQPERGLWDIVAVRLSVNGMRCERCAKSIEQRLLAMPGVISVRADHDLSRAAVSFDPSILELTAILATVENLHACDGRGFEAGARLAVGVTLDDWPGVPRLDGRWHRPE